MTRNTPASPRFAARPGRWPRRGSLLVEMTIAAAMLSVAMVMTVQVLGYSGQQRRASDQRQRAMLEVANLMERITAEPFDEVTAERARRLKIAPAAAGSLPGAELAVEVAGANAAPGPGGLAKRIAIRLRWKGRSGEWEAPVRLTTWIERGRPSS